MLTSRLGRQLSEAIEALNRIGASFALIGGLALASRSVLRVTQDVDLLVDLDQADEIDSELNRLGYSCLFRSENAGNYERGEERLDLLYASRPIARRLLGEAEDRQFTSHPGRGGYSRSAAGKPRFDQHERDCRIFPSLWSGVAVE